MNAGMFHKDHSPVGLYIENGKLLKELDTIKKAPGNFYLQPNGVFNINHDNTAQIKATTSLNDLNSIKYATQSGPMLVINDSIHRAFNKDSKNVQIRNAVGILPNGNVLLVLSKESINFYDLATFFKNQGCKNALYLDGYVSRIYDPMTPTANDNDHKFGVMIGITKK